MNLGLLLALLSALLYGLVNIFDKYIVSSRMRSPKSYIALVGIIHLIAGLALLFLLDLSKLTLNDYFIAIALGSLYGIQLLFYFILLSREDASNIIALDFSYPLITASLAFVLLSENIGAYGYVGMAVIMAGILSLKWRMKQTKSNTRVVVLMSMIATTGVYEFLMKVGVTNMDELAALSLNSIFAGLFVMSLLIQRATRADFLKYEIKNIKFAALSESVTIVAILFLLLAMARLPAAIAASITSIQPLIVLLGEFVLLRRVSKAVKDQRLLPKLISVALIVTGVVLIALTMDL